MRFFICGGGCYGTFYLRQLIRARSRGKLDATEFIVIDRDPNCEAVDAVADCEIARLEVADWIAFGRDVWAHEASWKADAWVPAPIAPHIAYEWLAQRLADRGWAVGRGTTSIPTEPLPFASALPNGSVALSHAPGVCPASCIEPRKCPLTRAERDWEMDQTVDESAAGSVLIHRCRHLTFGVGVIPLAEFYRSGRALVAAAEGGAASIEVATVSSCHGLVDTLEISRPQHEPEQLAGNDV